MMLQEECLYTPPYIDQIMHGRGNNIQFVMLGDD